MTAPERYEAIDVVRGAAVLGILLMNIVGQGLPSYAYVSPAYYGGDTGANLWAWALASVLVDGKMRGLFTLLFGASLLLIADRAASPARVHYSRMTWLLLFGILHALFVWYGDILVAYAIAGSIAFLARNLKPSRLLTLGGLILLALVLYGVAGHLYFASLRAAAEAPGATTAAITAWREAQAALTTQAVSTEAEIAGYRGGLVDAFHVRLPMTLFFWTFLLPTGFLWEALGFILVGMALFKLGYFTGRWPASIHARIASLLLPVGIVFGTFLTAAEWMSRWDAVTLLMTSSLAIPVHLLMALGYASAFLALAQSGAARGAVARLAACGRMALTNYLGANIIATTVFYGYGLGLFARLERAELYLVVAAIWAVQLAASKPWLERFRYGPFEWAWRSLARWERQPFRRAAVPSLA